MMKISFGRSARWLAYGRMIHRFRWVVVAGWMVLFLAGLPLASSVASRLQNSGYTASSSSQSSRVEGLLSSSLHRPTTQVLVVFHSDLPLTDPAYQRRLQAFLARVRTFPHAVGSP